MIKNVALECVVLLYFNILLPLIDVIALVAAELPGLMSGQYHLLSADKAGAFRCPVRILQVISGRPIAVLAAILPWLLQVEHGILFSAYRTYLFELPVTVLSVPSSGAELGAELPGTVLTLLKDRTALHAVSDKWMGFPLRLEPGVS